MGCNIAKLFAANGCRTRLYDANTGALDNARPIANDFGNLHLVNRLGDAVTDAGLVVESIYEDLEAKRELYSAIVPFLNDGAVVFSNTSSFSLAELSSHLPFSDRIGLMHFFNPADVVPLVEVVKPMQLDRAAFDKILDLLKVCHKVPVVLKKDIPGFIANRLQTAVLREACYLVAQGIAEEADVDAAMRDGIGLRWACAGPFQIADYGGLDIWSKVLESLLVGLDDAVQVPDIILGHVREGRLGYKAGHGFYDYEQDADSGLGTYRDRLLRLLAASRGNG